MLLYRNEICNFHHLNLYNVESGQTFFANIAWHNANQHRRQVLWNRQLISRIQSKQDLSHICVQLLYQLN